MRELDKISEALFNKIRARFNNLSIGDENAQSTNEPEKSRFFNFDYVNREGKNYGNVTISLIDQNALKIYYSTNITDGLNGEEQKDWYSFLKDIRMFAKRNMLTFDTRDINKSNLELKDIKQQIRADGTYTKDELAIAEGKLYGHGNNKHVSFGDVGTHKLIIKHKDQIDPERHGARARKIEHIFIETPIGERFLLDHVNLEGARATANHLRYGGKFGDEGTKFINEMVREMASMRHFVRSMKTRTFEDTETSGMVDAAIHRYNEVKDNLKKFQGRHGQNLLMDQLSSQVMLDDNVDIDSLRERFVKKIYDDRFNDALPYVYRAFQKEKEKETSESRQFHAWADSIAETSWQDDSDDTNEIDLLQLVQSPLLVGIDAIDVKSVISQIPYMDEEDLFTQLENLAATSGPDADSRLVLAQWLSANGEQSLSNQIMQILQQQNTNTQQPPTQPDNPPSPVNGASTMDEPVVNEEISILRWLSGLGKK